MKSGKDMLSELAEDIRSEAESLRIYNVFLEKIPGFIDYLHETKALMLIVAKKIGIEETLKINDTFEHLKSNND